MAGIQVDQLNIKVVANTSTAVKNIDKLWRSIFSLYEACQEFKGSGVQTSINNLSDSFERFASSIQNVSTRKIQSFTKDLTNAEKGLSNAEKKIAKDLSGTNFQKRTDVSSTITEKAIAKSEEAVKKESVTKNKSTKPLGNINNVAYSNAYWEQMQKAFKSSGNPLTDAKAKFVQNEFNNNLKKIPLPTDYLKIKTSAFAKAEKDVQTKMRLLQAQFPATDKNAPTANTEKTTSKLDAIKEKINKVFDNTFSKLKKVKSKVADTTESAKKNIDSIKVNGNNTDKNSTPGKLGQLFQSLNRIAFYRIIRTILKSITTALKQGIDSVYQYSLKAGTNFAKSMDSIATDVKYFINSVGSVLEPLLNVVAPIFNKIINFLVEANNKIAEFLAQITGADSWTKAIRYQQKYAESVKATTLGIDELNIMNGNANSDYSKMFSTETVETTDKITDNISGLKQTFDDLKQPISTFFGKFKKFGKFLSEKLAPLVSKVLAPIAEWTLGELTPATFDLLGQAVESFQNIIEPFAESFDTIKKNVLDPIGNLLSTTILTSLTTLKTDFKTIGDYFKNNKDDIKTSIEIWSSALGTLLDIVSPVVTKVVELIGIFTNETTKVGLNLFNAALQTLTGALQMLDGFLSMDSLKFFQGFATSLLPIINLFIWLTNCIGSAFNAVMNLINGTNYKYEEIPYQTVTGMQQAIHDAMYGTDSGTNNTSIVIGDSTSTSQSIEELLDDLKAIRENTAKGTTITSSSIATAQDRTTTRTGALPLPR